MNENPAFPAYYLPFPPDGHQVDLLGEYVGEDVTIDPALWPECSKRIHGVDEGVVKFYCVHKECALYWEELKSFNCRSCPVRCGREDG